MCARINLVSSPFRLARSANQSRNRFCLLGAQFATEAAITVLRIDDMVKLEKGEDDMEE